MCQWWNRLASRRSRTPPAQAGWHTRWRVAAAGDAEVIAGGNRVARGSEESCASGWNRRQVDVERFLRQRVSWGNRFKNVVEGKRYSLLRNFAFDDEYRSFLLRPETRHMPNAALMLLLVSQKRGFGEARWIVINQFMTGRTEGHEVFYSVYIFRPVRAPTRTIFTESHDVGHLRKVSFRQGDVMFEQIRVTAIKFTSSPSANKQL